MKAPVLNRHLVLEAAEDTPDGSGGYVRSWAALGRLWGEVRPGTGREVAGGEVKLASLPCRIVIRARGQSAPSRPKPGQRFRDGARFYSILAVTETDPGARYLTCFAREEVPA